MVAEEFQIDLAKVKITGTTTAKVPNTSATAASSGSDLNGMAARAAAKTIKGQAGRLCRRALPCRPRAGGLRGEPRAHRQRREGPFRSSSARPISPRISLSSTGFYATPGIAYDRETASGTPFYYFAYGAACSEVVIDTLTGEYKLLRADILHDVGKSLNPALDRGQIEGGFIQGMGWLTMEELWWDEKGALKTHAPSTYKIPTANDRPDDLRIALWDRGENRSATIYRSKAVGEPPFMLAISVFCALSDAVLAAGDGKTFPDLDAPATPERVLKAVEGVRGERAVMPDLPQQRHRTIADGAPAILVAVARALGSTPREAGASMLVCATSMSGTIGGGRLEFDAIARARTMLASGEALAQMDVPLGPEIGQCCGGRVLLSLRRVDAAMVETLRAEAASDRAMRTPCPHLRRRPHRPRARRRSGAAALAGDADRQPARNAGRSARIGRDVGGGAAGGRSRARARRRCLSRDDPRSFTGFPRRLGRARAKGRRLCRHDRLGDETPAVSAAPSGRGAGGRASTACAADRRHASARQAARGHRRTDGGGTRHMPFF